MDGRKARNQARGFPFSATKVKTVAIIISKMQEQLESSASLILSSFLMCTHAIIGGTVLLGK